MPSTFSLSGADEKPIIAGSIAWQAVAESVASIIAARVQGLNFIVIVLSVGVFFRFSVCRTGGGGWAGKAGDVSHECLGEARIRLQHHPDTAGVPENRQLI